MSPPIDERQEPQEFIADDVKQKFISLGTARRDAEGEYDPAVGEVGTLTPENVQERFLRALGARVEELGLHLQDPADPRPGDIVLSLSAVPNSKDRNEVHVMAKLTFPNATAETRTSLMRLRHFLDSQNVRTR